MRTIGRTVLDFLEGLVYFIGAVAITGIGVLAYFDKVGARSTQGFTVAAVAGVVLVLLPALVAWRKKVSYFQAVRSLITRVIDVFLDMFLGFIH